MVTKIKMTDPALSSRWEMPRAFFGTRTKVTPNCWKISANGMPVPARGRADARRINLFHGLVDAAIMVDNHEYNATHWTAHLHDVNEDMEADCCWRVEATILLHAIYAGRLDLVDRQLLCAVWTNPAYTWIYINPTNYHDIVEAASKLQR